jgi:hypothetical protein
MKASAKPEWAWSRDVPHRDGWYWFWSETLGMPAPHPAWIEHVDGCDGPAINMSVGRVADDASTMPGLWWPVRIEPPSGWGAHWTRTPPETAGFFLYLDAGRGPFEGAEFNVAEVTSDEFDDEISFTASMPDGPDAETCDDLDAFDGEWSSVPLVAPPHPISHFL